MKISEKTLELNICAQVSQWIGSKQQLLWFGLTQKQEARAGFDACTRLGGRLLIFQFKASNKVLKSGERMFLASHKQLVALSKQTGRLRSVFYAFPLVGTTAELIANPDLVTQTWLLDVASLPMITAPTTLKGTVRKNNCHNVYVRAGQAVIRSEPIRTGLIRLSSFASEGFPGADGLNGVFEDRFEMFWEFISQFSRTSRGLILW